MVSITLFRMPYSNHLFNKNQKVFVQNFTGAMACRVSGRHRGGGRYISGWVNYVVPPVFTDVLVDITFAQRHRLFYYE